MSEPEVQEPSLEVIAERAAQVRARWTDRDFEIRGTHFAPKKRNQAVTYQSPIEWTPPECQTPTTYRDD